MRGREETRERRGPRHPGTDPATDVGLRARTVSAASAVPSSGMGDGWARRPPAPKGAPEIPRLPRRHCPLVARACVAIDGGMPCVIRHRR